jgi:hypothetical protein
MQPRPGRVYLAPVTTRPAYARCGLQLAGPHPLLETGWQVWYGGYFLGSSRHCAPVPSPRSQHPQDSIEHGARILP